MDKDRDTRQPTGVRQWKRELEILRSEIARQHRQVIERVRDEESHLLDALDWFAEPDDFRLDFIRGPVIGGPAEVWRRVFSGEPGNTGAWSLRTWQAAQTPGSPGERAAKSNGTTPVPAARISPF